MLGRLNNALCLTAYVHLHVLRRLYSDAHFFIIFLFTSLFFYLASHFSLHISPYPETMIVINREFVCKLQAIIETMDSPCSSPSFSHSSFQTIRFSSIFVQRRITVTDGEEQSNSEALAWPHPLDRLFLFPLYFVRSLVMQIRSCLKTHIKYLSIWLWCKRAS